MVSDQIDVFIDESGIGRKVGYSVYCLTLSPSKQKYYLDRDILKIEQELRVPTFHWREQSWRIKKKFLRQILKLSYWSSVVCIVENKAHPYQTPEEIIIKGLWGVDSETIYIDGKKTKRYSHAVKRSLKGLGLNISSLKMVSSASCGGLRISDAIAGLIRLSLESTLEPDVLELLRRVSQKITTQVVSGHLPNPPHGR